MGEEHCHDQQNSGEISPGELHRGGTRYPIRLDIYATRHLGHGVCVRGIVEGAPGKLFTCLLFGTTKTLSPIVGALSKIPVKIYVLVLLNLVTSAKEKYPSSQQESVELI